MLEQGNCARTVPLQLLQWILQIVFYSGSGCRIKHINTLGTIYPTLDNKITQEQMSIIHILTDHSKTSIITFVQLRTIACPTKLEKLCCGFSETCHVNSPSLLFTSIRIIFISFEHWPFIFWSININSYMLTFWYILFHRIRVATHCQSLFIIWDRS